MKDQIKGLQESWGAGGSWLQCMAIEQGVMGLNKKGRYR